MPLSNTISVTIQADDGSAPKQILNIPWFPGITVLKAMVIGQAMNPGLFSFRVVYNSLYGAFVDMIDGVSDQPPKFWMFSVSNNPPPVGVSEAIVLESAAVQNVDVEWSNVVPGKHPASALQGERKQKIYRSN